MGKALCPDENRKRKIELDRMAAMLSRLGGRGYTVKEDFESYGENAFDFDSDPDSDGERNNML